MIPYIFHLFWAGDHLSYLRYLTFKTCRLKNPDARIILHHSSSYAKNINWTREKQDFQTDMGPSYFDKLKDLNVEIVPYTKHTELQPNYQSDFMRWECLYQDGGIYADTDQIFLKSFNNLLNCDFFYCSYFARIIYYPVGLIGSISGHFIPAQMIQLTKQHLNTNEYQSIGPPLFRALMTHPQVAPQILSQGIRNYPQEYFYPAPEPDKYCEAMFEGNGPDVTKSYALHWFGGYSKSHEFNSKYTETLVKSSNDTISTLIREMKAI